MNSLPLLVADLAFVSSTVAGNNLLVPVFPMKKGDGAFRATLSELLERSRLQSSFIDSALPGIISAFCDAIPHVGFESGIVVRQMLVIVTSLFVDRYLRTIHRMRQFHGRVAVVDVVPIKEIQWPSEISSISNISWRLNQEIIHRIMVGLGHESFPLFAPEAYPEYPNLYSVPNFLFLPQPGKWRRLMQRLLGRALLILNAFPNPKARILSTGLVYDEHYISRSGFYGPLGLLRRSGRPPSLQTGVKDPILREKLRNVLRPVSKVQVQNLLAKIDPLLDTSNADCLYEAWLGMFIDWYPVALLEGWSGNLAKVRESLDLDRAEAIIGAELTSDIGLLQCISTRLAEKKIIGVQHTAGHYGYIEDMSAVAQPEYPLYDAMVTFGWVRIDDHLPQCKTIALPCPKLSEKPLASNYLGNRNSSVGERSDVLFLSNTFHRFPHVSTCGQARVDFIDEISDSQEEMVRAITAAGLTIDHKPYSNRFLDLYPELYRRLQKVGSSNYRTIDVRQKGLTVELIKSCRIVLWDQIGSGAMECLTAGVPTIIFWQRIYSREVSWAKELINDLEGCGIVHDDPDKLASEIKNYLSDPEQWMTDERRVRSIKAFCRHFAWTEPHWQDIWAKQLKELSLVNVKDCGT